MNKLKVAILEDNKDQLKDRKINLEESGLANVVIWATNSTEFLEKVNQEKPDALLLDIDLGNNDNMSGLEVAYKLKLPVMFVSGHNAANLTKIENLKREYDFTVEHITKPFTDSEFIKTVTRFLLEVKEKLLASFVFLDFKESKRNKIAVDTIVFLESETGKSGESNNKTIYFTDRKPETLFDFTFKNMALLGFNKNKFLTVHRSFVVNEKHIKSYKKSTHEIEVEFLNSFGKSEHKLLKVSENFKMK